MLSGCLFQSLRCYSCERLPRMLLVLWCFSADASNSASVIAGSSSDLQSGVAIMFCSGRTQVLNGALKWSCAVQTAIKKTNVWAPPESPRGDRFSYVTWTNGLEYLGILRRQSLNLNNHARPAADVCSCSLTCFLSSSMEETPHGFFLSERSHATAPSFCQSICRFYSKTACLSHWMEHHRPSYFCH